MISISRRRAGKLASTSCLISFCANHESRSCTGEMLTDSVSLGSHAMASRKAWAIRLCDSWSITPISSAIGMKTCGPTTPKTGDFHRASISKPVSSPAADIDLLLVIRHEFTERDAAPDAGFQFAPHAQFVLHRRLVPEVAVPALALGVIHGDVGGIEQVGDVVAVEVGRRARVAARDADRNRNPVDRPVAARRRGHGRDQPRGQFLDALGLCGVERHQADEFVAADPRGYGARGGRIAAIRRAHSCSTWSPSPWP